jgi:biopolymer transport protein ExbD
MEDYKWSDLSDKLTKIKKGAQDDDRNSDNVVLIPEPNIKYEILVKAMDVTRKNGDTSLFPKVSFAGGTNAN